MALPRHDVLTTAITFTLAGLLVLWSPRLGLLAALAALLRILLVVGRR